MHWGKRVDAVRDDRPRRDLVWASLLGTLLWVHAGGCGNESNVGETDIALPTFDVSGDSPLQPTPTATAPPGVESPAPSSSETPWTAETTPPPGPTSRPGDDATPTPGTVPGTSPTPGHLEATTATPTGDDDIPEPTPPWDQDGDGVDLASGDCDDNDTTVYPGAEEVCDGKDNDCDTLVDDRDPDAVAVPVWYLDADGDGYGDKTSIVSQQRCEPPNGYSDNYLDCDDAHPDVYPGADEICDGKDNDCDIQVDEGPDADGDGFSTCDDCDDTDSTTHPDAPEQCDGKDNDCDGAIDEDIPPTMFYADSDGDGYGDAEVSTLGCAPPAGYTRDDTDCDDGDPDVHPGADEVCDSKDNDCDDTIDEDVLPTWYLDYDGDGYGGDRWPTAACSPPTPQYIARNGDCDDTRDDVYPGHEALCDGLDHNCDGLVDNDADLDGYPDALCGGTDCDDGDDTTYPGAAPGCDGRDHDCDGVPEQDADGDGYSDASCGGSDCDDTRVEVYPGAPPGCDGADHDCDGAIDNDRDGDGFSDMACGGTDCNDLDPTMRPDTNGLCALGRSCADILENDFGDTDGVYVVDPDGFGAGGTPFAVTCDMTTDGGGWTIFYDWNREGGGDDLESFETGLRRLFNDMGEFTDQLGPFLQWSDLDGTGDVMAYSVAVPVPNHGELRLGIHYEGQSMERSGTFLFAEAGGAPWNLLCRDDTHEMDFTEEEWAYHPTYPCVDSADGSWTWQGDQQFDIGVALNAVHLHSFHLDNNHGDISRLYRLTLAVR